MIVLKYYVTIVSISGRVRAHVILSHTSYIKYFEEINNLKGCKGYINTDLKIKLTKVIWEVNGVKEVNNKVQISETNNIKNIAKDLASLGEIKARLMASKKLNSLNFSIDVVNNVAYISGIASSEEEIAIVNKIAQEAKFIKEVQNFVKINKDKR